MNIYISIVYVCINVPAMNIKTEPVEAIQTSSAIFVQDYKF